MEILPTHTQINPNHNPKSTAQPLCIGFEHAPLGAVLGSLGNPWGTLLHPRGFPSCPWVPSVAF